MKNLTIPGAISKYGPVTLRMMIPTFSEEDEIPRTWRFRLANVLRRIADRIQPGWISVAIEIPTNAEFEKQDHIEAMAFGLTSMREYLVMLIRERNVVPLPPVKRS